MTPKIKHLSLAIIFFTAMNSLSFSAPLNVYDNNYSPSSPVFNFDAKDSASLLVIDRLNEYRYSLLIISYMEDIENNFNNRIHYEMHLGGGPVYHYNEDCTCGTFFLSLKVNLNNPKIAQPKEIISSIHKVRNLLSFGKCPFADKMNKQCDTIEAAINDYNKKFWFKRFSLGVAFPGIECWQGCSSPSSNIVYLKYDQPFLFIGTDLGDIMTLQGGISARSSIMIGASVDISTPIYVSASNFIGMLRNFFKTPTPNSYNYVYD